MIRVYADWQPGYMGEKVPTETEYFKTLEEAESRINQWRKTAGRVIIFEVEEKVIATYVWGKKVK